MFIILAANQNSTRGLIVLAVAVAMSLAIAIVAGVLPPRRVASAPRIPPERPAWPLLVVLLWSAGLSISSAGMYRTYCERKASRLAGHDVHIDPFPADDRQTAMLFVLPPLVGLLALLLGDYAVREACGQELGCGPRRLPGGIARGAVGILIVLPPLMALSVAMEALYRRIHYEHPAEHPLLRVLGHQPDSPTMATIFAGAWLLAPLWEELAFRGHLQTLLKRLFERLVAVWEPSPFPAIDVDPRPSPGKVLAYASPPPALATGSPRAAWAAILCTSLLFALVHEPWSQPVIFALAVCLGYAYERTRNLWVPITMHALFNTFSTFLFLGTR